MDFTNFTKLISEEVAKKIGNGYKVRINDVRKNNNIVLTGLTVTQNDNNVSPTIYLNHYYKEYANGRVTLPNVVNDVIDTYNRNKISQSVDMRYFLNYDGVKQHIVFKLINTERNRELLEDVPHMEFLDLSIVFQCIVAQEELGLSSILIHNTHLKLWDVTTEDLYKAAKENTPKLMPYEIKSMTEVLCDIIQSEHPEEYNYDECIEQFSDSVPMFVLSNKSRIEGATCMLYPNLIRDFSDAIGNSFYIIPSSIHELLLLPTENDEECGEIKSMIKEINDTQVSEAEILSYSLYFYDRETGKIVRL